LAELVESVQVVSLILASTSQGNRVNMPLLESHVYVGFPSKNFTTETQGT
jgi:hypothetical protein